MTFSKLKVILIITEKKAKDAEQQMKLIAQRAREENRLSLTRASQLIINANRLTQGEKPPLPPKYVVL